MANLTGEQLTHLKNLLEERNKALRADLVRELNAKEGFMQVASEAPDPGDSSFANLEVDLENAAVTRDVVEVRAIEAARIRMENGTYGDCVVCETEIPYERLLVQPTAERCAPCQERYEKTHQDPMRGNTL
ncbi:MAG TPA: TraR/DksA family transcriptional regulator [Noviherbaspirillum sp.]|nr:TraR/DksA family transcriptional regulator [Noviherbaspirillum sp.]